MSGMAGTAGTEPALGPFEITADPLSVDQLAAEVQTPADGAVVTFVGLVRAAGVTTDWRNPRFRPR